MTALEHLRRAAQSAEQATTWYNTGREEDQALAQTNALISLAHANIALAAAVLRLDAVPGAGEDS